MTIISIEDKITICEHLDKGSYKSEIACEYNDPPLVGLINLSTFLR